MARLSAITKQTDGGLPAMPSDADHATLECSTLSQFDEPVASTSTQDASTTSSASQHTQKTPVPKRIPPIPRPGVLSTGKSPVAKLKKQLEKKMGIPSPPAKPVSRKRKSTAEAGPKEPKATAKKPRTPAKPKTPNMQEGKTPKQAKKTPKKSSSFAEVVLAESISGELMASTSEDQGTYLNLSGSETEGEDGSEGREEEEESEPTGGKSRKSLEQTLASLKEMCKQQTLPRYRNTVKITRRRKLYGKKNKPENADESESLPSSSKVKPQPKPQTRWVHSMNESAREGQLVPSDGVKVRTTRAGRTSKTAERYTPRVVPQRRSAFLWTIEETQSLYDGLRMLQKRGNYEPDDYEFLQKFVPNHTIDSIMENVGSLKDLGANLMRSSYSVGNNITFETKDEMRRTNIARWMGLTTEITPNGDTWVERSLSKIVSLIGQFEEHELGALLGEIETSGSTELAQIDDDMQQKSTKILENLRPNFKEIYAQMAALLRGQCGEVALGPVDSTIFDLLIKSVQHRANTIARNRPELLEYVEAKGRILGQRIENNNFSQYGKGILLEPPSGLSQDDVAFYDWLKESTKYDVEKSALFKKPFKPPLFAGNPFCIPPSCRDLGPLMPEGFANCDSDLEME